MGIHIRNQKRMAFVINACYHLTCNDFQDFLHSVSSDGVALDQATGGLGRDRAKASCERATLLVRRHANTCIYTICKSRIQTQTADVLHMCMHAYMRDRPDGAFSFNALSCTIQTRCVFDAVAQKAVDGSEAGRCTHQLERYCNPVHWPLD